MSPAVLDASALLAWLGDEPGVAAVDEVLSESYMSAVTWSETAQKLARDGDDPQVTLRRVEVLGVEVVPFGTADALAAAALWETTRPAGLSLGDRACLALARDRELTALTADTAWVTVETGAAVRLIR
jgi:PIN domain nuclease of toxin-antitoxin system